jgi:hypothetical protein
MLRLRNLSLYEQILEFSRKFWTMGPFQLAMKLVYVHLL